MRRSPRPGGLLWSARTTAGWPLSCPLRRCRYWRLAAAQPRPSRVPRPARVRMYLTYLWAPWGLPTQDRPWSDPSPAFSWPRRKCQAYDLAFRSRLWGARELASKDSHSRSQSLSCSWRRRERQAWIWASDRRVRQLGQWASTRCSSFVNDLLAR